MPLKATLSALPARSHQGRSPCHARSQGRARPSFEIIEPPEWHGPVVFNSPHSGSIYPRAFLTTSRLDTATLRRSEDSFVDELVLGVVRRGFPLMRAHFPRCYVDVNREPYELDPRMFEVACRRSPIPGRCGWRGARHRREGGRRRAGNLRPAHPGRRRHPPHRGALQALSPGVAPAVHAGAPRFRGGGADRLPFHAVHRRLQGRAAARRRRAGRPLRHQLRHGGRRNDRGDAAQPGLFGEPQQALCGRLHHRALRQPGRRPARDQLEINRALYMDERRFERSPSFGGLAADLETLPSGSAPCRSRSCDPIAPPPSRRAPADLPGFGDSQ